jgi:hypothetical protein
MLCSYVPRRISWLLPAAAAVSIVLSAQFSNAAMDFVIAGTNGATSFSIPASGGNVPLIVYALIQDGATGAPDPNGNDGIQSFEQGITMTGALIADASLYRTGTTVGISYQPTPGGASTSTQMWSSGGTIGLGATNSTTTAASGQATSIYAGYNSSVSPANGPNGNNVYTIDTLVGSHGATAGNKASTAWTTDGAMVATLQGPLAAYSNYTAIPIYSFSASFTAGSGGTAALGLINASYNGNSTSGLFIWSEAGQLFQQNGNNSVTGTVGAVNAGTLGGLLDTVTFTQPSSGTTSTNVVGRADLGAVIAVPQSLLSGGTTAIGTSLTNTSYATAGQTQDTISWSVSSSFGGTTSGASLAPGSSASVALTYTAPANFFGPATLTLTPSGTGPTGTALTTGPATAVLSIIGSATKGSSADGTGTPYVYLGNTLTSGPITLGQNLAGMETTLGTSASAGIGQTYALILAGTSGVSAPGGITMTWRSRASSELPIHANSAVNALPLYSDVVNLSGLGGATSNVSGGTATTFTLQMSYDPSELGGTAAAATAASNGFLYLGYRSANGGWFNAVTVDGTVVHGQTVTDGNTGTGSLVSSAGFGTTNGTEDYPGSWTAFLAGPGAAGATNLSSLLGAWGVNTANDTTWAVIDHDAEFAVVPEPGTLALLAAGVAAMGFAYRRRKAVKA